VQSQLEAWLVVSVILVGRTAPLMVWNWQVCRSAWCSCSSFAFHECLWISIHQCGCILGLPI